MIHTFIKDRFLGASKTKEDIDDTETKSVDYFENDLQVKFYIEAPFQIYEIV